MRGIEVVVRGVSKDYQLKTTLVHAVRHADLYASPFKITVIYGPSGSGKSVLLNIIAGFEKPDRGVVRVSGINIAGMSWRRLIEY